VEHSQNIKIIAIALLFCLACTRPQSNPELSDPIYQDLKAQEANSSKAIEGKKKELEAAEKEAEKPDLEPMALKQNRKTRFALEKTLRLLEQDHTYFEIKAAERKDLDAHTYPESFKTKSPWPPKGEIEAYATEQRLRNASRNWNDRVPKPANAPKPETTEKKAEKKKEE
jgi:hypothetical protein